MSTAVEISGVVKSYSALRPLRIASLSVADGERVAIMGIDAGGAEVFLNLVTGASLPDEGVVRVFGADTAAIKDGETWLASLDRFGIVSDRAVLLEGASVAQNLAMPFTLAIDPIEADTLRQVRRLAEECEIEPASLEAAAGSASPAVRARIHFARAIALDPRVLLMDHPTAAFADADRAAYGTLVARVCGARGITMLAVTMDSVFAARAAGRTLTLQPATGQLVAARRWSWNR